MVYMLAEMTYSKILQNLGILLEYENHKVILQLLLSECPVDIAQGID